MGIKNFFKTKPPSEDEINSKVRDEMNEHGIPTKSNKKKPQLFAAYNNYANDKSEKKIYAPKGYEEHAQNNRGEKVVVPGENNGVNGPYDGIQQTSSADSSNPYANYGTAGGSNGSSNPYSTMNSQNSYGSNNGSSGHSQNPYAQGSSSANPYAQPSSSSSSSQPVHGGGANRSNPYAQNNTGNKSARRGYDQESIRGGQGQGQGRPQANPYASRSSAVKRPEYAASQNQTAVEEDDFNQLPDNASTRPPSYRQQMVQHPRDKQHQQQQGFDFEDLNELPQEEQDAQYGYGAVEQEQEYEQTLSPEELEELEKQRQEDEEVEGIKDQIKYTKQDSVASTRNTLKMAREAEESGKNTMGMLGSQSETLYNIERNLDLAKTQDKIAKEKVAQLHHYNRNILKPSVQNPFTKSRRLREKEERIKNDRLQSKLIQDQQRRELSESTNRIKSSLNDGDHPGDSVAAKYKREKYLQQAKQYQFEADSEDDEMENEIGENLDEIGKIAGRLRKLAVNQGEEIDRQNYRLRNVEEDMSELDINVHLNTTRLSGTR